jgi:hypothetical protein
MLSRVPFRDAVTLRGGRSGSPWRMADLAGMSMNPLEQDIEARLVAAGIVVPPDLKAGVLAEARDLLRMAALLRGPRTAAAEPFGLPWAEAMP